MTGTIQQFDLSVNLMQALLWQYDNATSLKSLMQQKQDWYDLNQTQFWENWYRDVFNLKTANDFGLQVWSIILGQPVYINNGPITRSTWGFEQYHKNFTNGNFATAHGAPFRLNTETARVLLRLRYYQLTGSGTVPEINRLLADVFAGYSPDSDSPAYVIDNHNMTQLIVFTFPLTAELYFIFNNIDILPRPAGVGSEYRVIVGESWGFDAFHENFDHGNFSEL